MKKLFFAFVLLSGAALVSVPAAVQAQTATAAAPRSGDEGRLDMASKVNELEASIMRNKPEMTQVLMPQIMAMMQVRMTRNGDAAGKLSGDAQTKLMANMKAEQMLYSAFKRLSSEPVKNQKELVSTARKFIEIY